MNWKLISAGVLLTANAAMAGTWYAGADVSDIKIKFEPQYAFANGRPDSSFTDWAYGEEVGVLGGYKIKLCHAADLAIQGRFAANNAEWTLSTDEPAELKYEMPYAYSIGLVPSCRIVKNLSVFAELAVGEGKISQEKSTPAFDSSYDFNDWVGGYTVGGGLKYKVNPRIGVFAIYRFVNYDSYTFESHLPDGSVAEIISDSPSSYSVSAGVTVEL